MPIRYLAFRGPASGRDEIPGVLVSYQVDFHAVEKTGEIGSKSGDAISIRFIEAATQAQRVVVIDGGYKGTSERVMAHMEEFYKTSHIDLMISTHPDQDHINGLASLLDLTTVGEILMHDPHQHHADAINVNNIEVVDAILGIAQDRRIPVTEPFQGLTRFGSQILVLGPTRGHYEQMLSKHLSEVASGAASARIASAMRETFAKAGDLLERKAAGFGIPVETLGEDGETSPRNEMSVVTLLAVNGDRMLFTGDAGIDGMGMACDYYEVLFGSFQSQPLSLFQAPHHGSRRNLSPSLLNRMFGEPGYGPGNAVSVISSAKADEKHPSPKVTNALKRRGVEVTATESRTLMEASLDWPRDGWTPIPSLDYLLEEDES